jgi:branched-chain amino acid transport system ATP-binding protein
MSASMPVVAIEALCKDFGGLRAIDDLSLEVRQGEILGIVGPNGAGKSVLINLITGFYQATSGTIRFKERAITGLSRHAISRLGITRTFQNIRLFKRMSVLENVLVANKRHARAPFAALFGFGHQRRDIEQASISWGSPRAPISWPTRLPMGMQGGLRSRERLLVSPACFSLMNRRPE